MRDYEQYEDEDERPRRRRVRPAEVEYYLPAPQPPRNDGSSVFYGLLCGALIMAALGLFGLALWQNRASTGTAQAQEVVTPTPIIIEMTATASATAQPQPTIEPSATPVPPPTARPAPPAPAPVQVQQPAPTAPPVDPTVCAITDNVPQSNVCGPRSQAETLKAQSMMIANQVLGGNIVTIVTQVPTE